MQITEKGEYKLTKDFRTWNNVSVGTIPKGTVIKITRVDLGRHKVIGPELFDWASNEMPVEKT